MTLMFLEEAFFFGLVGGLGLLGIILVYSVELVFESFLCYSCSAYSWLGDDGVKSGGACISFFF